MAAEFVLTFAAEGILTKVYSLAAQELALAWGFKAELEKLGESVSSIQDFLRSAADQRPDDRGKAVEKWVKKLKQVAEDADDILDDINYELLRRKVELHNHMKRKDEAAFINLVAKKGDSRHRPDREQTDSFFKNDEKEKEKVVGREDAVTKIVTTLISSDNQQKNLSVMAIVGMGGLGKTTLAKLVYNEPAIGTHFDKRIWLCVSNTFEVDAILSQMVDSLVPEKAGMKNRDAVLKVLGNEITGKRYVLVLDDVWNEERKKWDSLMGCLSKLNSNSGSCIIVTTRSTNVSTIAETLPRPELRNLSKEECWSIIKQMDENGIIDAELERIGWEIAEKCGGVPLVAKVLGSLLCSSASKDEWLSIRKKLWELPEGEDRIMKLWMAQGLLQTSSVENHHEMEHTGKVYFNILLNNSLFQEVIEGGTVTKYTMHDLVHDLAEKVSKSERLTQELNDDVRHVARSRPPSTLENMSKVTAGRLRSLFSNDRVPEMIFSKFKAMRVLSLNTADIEELPNSFGKLKHLRYLDLSSTRITALPKSIGKLYNLQTLRMRGARHLKELPREMQNLINLRHLYVDEEIEFPAGMFRGLTNLRTLSCFNVGEEMGCRIEELGGLNQLKGMLTIGNLQNVRDEAEAKKAKLEEKKNVVELSLVFSEYSADRRTSNTNDEKVLEGLEPHTELESLKIVGFRGYRFPSWMMRVPLPLNKLKKLVLRGCFRCGELPILGHLPFLRDVEIKGMHNLKRIGSEIYGYDLVDEATREKERIVLFPALKTLSIEECHELIEWMEAPTTTTTTKVEVFPCLEELTIKYCEALSSIGLTSSLGLPSLRKLIIRGCDGLSALPSGIENCTSLELLQVSVCGNLATISFTRVLPSLRKLQVWNCDNLSCLAVPEYCQELIVSRCPKLASITFSTDLNPCLKELIIEDCNCLQSLPDFRSFTSLRELRIGGCAGIGSLVSEFHIPVSLEQLWISGFHNLESIPRLEECTSLRRFEVGHCDKLKFLPTGLSCLARLEDLELGPFREDLDSFPDFQVPSQQLVSLRLIGWPKLKSLPQQVQHLTSLTRLTIWYFNGVEILPEWLGNLASLMNLSIYFCDNLKYLPSLEAMQRLTKLQHLSVSRCPLLKERCTKDSGEEWPKISHIRDIEIY
ncbi:hypothetical protein ACLB2K_058073 [Fragaria x ananassa]